MAEITEYINVFCLRRSLKLMDSILNITFFVMALWVSHRDVANKFNPVEFSPAFAGMTNWK
jgi:hypothetical protein